VSAPGRLCLFGEHQDYLGLPVVPMAISLRVAIEGTRRTDRIVRVDLPDVSSFLEFSLDGPLRYEGTADYLRGAVNVLRREGYTFSTGFDCSVRGGIPIRAGTSSSSAMVVAWVFFLARMSEEARALPPAEAARLAHAAEVVEFGGAGGLMDQCAAAYGGAAAVSFHPALSVEQLDAPAGAFVLGDSREPKDTQAVLSRVRSRVLGVARRLAERHPGFSLREAPFEDHGRYAAELARGELDLLGATLMNRDITRVAIDRFRAGRLDDRTLGAMLDEQQILLREVLAISTPKIDRLLDSALRAGALGGKINGSGGGGCMFAYAPGSAPAVAEAIERAGGTAHVVRAGEGVRIEAACG
jgi:galactokinase